MAIDVTKDSLLTLADASKVLPTLNGRKISIPSLWRWCRIGISGVRLEYVRFGRNICTTAEALNRFCEDLAKADRPLGCAPRPNLPSLMRKTPRAIRELSLKQADEAMRELGVVPRQKP